MSEVNDPTKYQIHHAPVTLDWRESAMLEHDFIIQVHYCA